MPAGQEMVSGSTLDGLAPDRTYSVGLIGFETA
jgi:hypothetical protein